jgi:hypothetical protein
MTFQILKEVMIDRRVSRLGKPCDVELDATDNFNNKKRKLGIV